jgi:hypothetical protein
MPECQNCGAHVTARYAQVFTPNKIDNPRVCPECDDMTRGGDGPRKKKT